MDYQAQADVIRHDSWTAFQDDRAGSRGRLLLFTTRATTSFLNVRFRPEDTLLFGRESAGVPDEVHAAADARLVIPMTAGARSLNVVAAAAIAIGEALRQTTGFPAIAQSV